MPKFKIIIHYEAEMETIDDEAVNFQFFKELEENNQTAETFLSDIMTVEEIK